MGTVPRCADVSAGPQKPSNRYREEVLDDIKAFFTKSSVAEVGVGLSIGAAFTAVIGEATQAGRSVLAGAADFSGLIQAAIALVTVAVLSVVLVVKPLAALKARADRLQTSRVEEAAHDDTDEPADADANSDAGVASAEPAEHEGEGEEAAEGESDAEVGTGEIVPAVTWGVDGPTPPATYAWGSEDDGALLTSATDLASATAGADVTGSGGVAASAVGAASTVARTSAPHSHTSTKACPYCRVRHPGHRGPMWVLHGGFE